MDIDHAPDVFVVLKNGTSYGTVDGTPLCVELDEKTARHQKIGLCVRYVPAHRVEHLIVAAKKLLDATSDIANTDWEDLDNAIGALK